MRLLAQVLELRGSQSQIEFAKGSISEKVVLSATCGLGQASFKVMTPASVDATQSNVTAYLHSVVPSCADASIDVPCVANFPAYPPLFSCSWTGELPGSVEVPKVTAQLEVHYHSDGLVLGAQAYILCQLPTYSQLVGIGYGGEGQFPLNLTVHHGLGAGRVELPYQGVPGGEVLTIVGLPKPPSAPPPSPTPPSPPPPGSPTFGLDMSALSEPPAGPWQLVMNVDTSDGGKLPSNRNSPATEVIQAHTPPSACRQCATLVGYRLLAVGLNICLGRNNHLGQGAPIRPRFQRPSRL